MSGCTDPAQVMVREAVDTWAALEAGSTPPLW